MTEKKSPCVLKFFLKNQVFFNIIYCVICFNFIVKEIQVKHFLFAVYRSLTTYGKKERTDFCLIRHAVELKPSGWTLPT